MQKRETAAYQRRRTNMPPPEPHTTDHYDFQMLSSSYHMLQWLADAPYAHICYNIEQLLRQKMADSRLLDIAATSMPQWQTVEIREEENGQTVAVSRTGMAFEFVLHVRQRPNPQTRRRIHLGGQPPKPPACRAATTNLARSQRHAGRIRRQPDGRAAEGSELNAWLYPPLFLTTLKHRFSFAETQLRLHQNIVLDVGWVRLQTVTQQSDTLFVGLRLWLTQRLAVSSIVLTTPKHRFSFTVTQLRLRQNIVFR